MSLKERARRFFGGRHPKPGNSPTRQNRIKTVSETETDDTGLPDLSALDRALTKMAEGRTELVAGRVQLLKFDNLRIKFGDQWDRLSERIQLVIQLAIQRRLTSEDVFTKHGELTFIILFANLSPEQAMLKCALIAEEVSTRLLGSDISPDDIEVHTATATVAGDIVMRRTESFTDLLAKISKRLDQTDVPSESIPQPDSADDAKSQERDKFTEELLRRQPPPFNASDLQFAYLPVWDVSRRVISTYSCVPIRLEKSGDIVVGEAAVPNRISHQNICELDCTILRFATAELMQAFSEGRKFLISIPVHYETLGSAQRRQMYLSECRTLDTKVASFTIFEVIGIPDGIPPSRLAETIASLKPICRAIIARCSPQENDLKKFKSAGVMVVGFEVSKRLNSEQNLMKDIDNFCERSEKEGLQTFIHGMNTLTLNTFAVSAGVSFICGHLLTSVISHPPGIERFDLNDMFGMPG